MDAFGLLCCLSEVSRCWIQDSTLVRLFVTVVSCAVRCSLIVVRAANAALSDAVAATRFARPEEASSLSSLSVTFFSIVEFTVWYGLWSTIVVSQKSWWASVNIVLKFVHVLSRVLSFLLSLHVSWKTLHWKLRLYAVLRSCFWAYGTPAACARSFACSIWSKDFQLVDAGQILFSFLYQHSVDLVEQFFHTLHTNNLAHPAFTHLQNLWSCVLVLLGMVVNCLDYSRFECFVCCNIFVKDALTFGMLSSCIRCFPCCASARNSRKWSWIYWYHKGLVREGIVCCWGDC